MAKLTKRDIIHIAERIKAVTPPFELHSGQKRVVEQVFKQGRRRILVIAGRSWGKSALCMYIAARLLCLPGKQAYIVGPTRKQQKEIMWEQPDGLKSYFPQTFAPKFMETEQRIELPWTSMVKIDGSENYPGFRGIAYDLMIIDEAQHVDWRFYEASYPNLSKKNGVLIVIGTMDVNLENPFMRLWREAQQDPSWMVIKAPSGENPKIREWLAEEKVRYYRRGDSALWEREYEANYQIGGKRSVLPMLNSDRHRRSRAQILEMIANDRHKLEYWTIFDPGTKSVFAVAFFAVNRNTGDVWMLAEIYETDPQFTTPRIMWNRTMAIEKELYPDGTKIFRVYDEAAAWFAITVASEFRGAIMPTTKESRSKMDDIGQIKDALLQDKFIMAIECEEAFKEMGSWQNTDLGVPDDKCKDHLIDCLRYLYRMSGIILADTYGPMLTLDADIQSPYHRAFEVDDHSIQPRVDSEVDFSVLESPWDYFQ